MTSAVTSFRVPFLDKPVEITARDKKVIAVAIASIAFFGIQMALSLSATLTITFLVTTLTYLSEKYLRTEQNDWFNTDFNKKELTFFVALLMLRPFIIQAVCWAFGIPLPMLAQVEIVERLLASPWKMIPIATFVAPVTEEILFRGFLLERIEDIIKNREISNIAHALIFGALHLRVKIEEGMKIPVFLSISFMGYLFGKMKELKRTLIYPMTFHSANNTSFVVAIFTTQH